MVKINLLLTLFLLTTDVVAQNYQWRNVAIGGGGYIVGVKVHPKNPSLIWVRTDIGGLYRWDEKRKMLVQAFNWVTDEKQNLYGIAGMALHPTNVNLIYAGAGKYASQLPHGVFRSADGGRTWMDLRFPVERPFNVNSSDADHRFGNPIEINPHNPDELWVGTVKDGLYIFNEAETTNRWMPVASLPSGASVRNIEFDSNSYFVYVGMRGKGVYRSADGGRSFSFIEGSDGFTIHDMDLSRDGDALYVTTETQGIQRLDDPKNASVWKSIAPQNLNEFRGLATSPHNNKVIITSPKVVAGLNAIYVSTDGGDTWMLKKKGRVNQIYPWHPDSYAGSAISQFVFDPVKPGTVYFTDWYSFWRTDNLFDTTVNWTNENGYGHEEVVTLVLACPPWNESGVLLYSGFADVSGFFHKKLDALPTKNIRIGGIYQGSMNDIAGFDYCENFPQYVALSGEDKHHSHTGLFAYSTDYGHSFTISRGYDTAWGYSRIAVARSTSTDLISVVAITKSGSLRYSTDGGKTWAASVHPLEAISIEMPQTVFNYRYVLVADRVLENTYYFYHMQSGWVWTSTDGGRSFHNIVQWPKATGDVFAIEVAPTIQNNIWGALGNEGLHFLNGTVSKKIPSVKEAVMVSLGAAEKAGAYPAIYLYGKINADTERWFYRSLDKGETWSRINNIQNRIGDKPLTLKADRQQFGRVFVGTDGTGVWYGEEDTR